MDGFSRQRAKYANELKRSCGALVGIAQGVLCDRALSDDEVRFLHDWLTSNDEICQGWPGDVIYKRVRDVLADGIITEAERAHLVETLQELIGGAHETLAAPVHVTKLAFDENPTLKYPGARFCLTGEFVYGPREKCATAITTRGGVIASSVTKQLGYLIIGGLGSVEWKHGSFGTKVERAMKYKRDGLPIAIVHEERWTTSLSVADQNYSQVPKIDNKTSLVEAFKDKIIELESLGWRVVLTDESIELFEDGNEKPTAAIKPNYSTVISIGVEDSAVELKRSDWPWRVFGPGFAAQIVDPEPDDDLGSNYKRLGAAIDAFLKQARQYAPKPG
jgi:hypothetical protein